MTKTLYPEQQTARYGINSMLNAKISHVFISPCGTGKTFTSCAVIKDRIALNERIYILVPQLEIFEQWINELSEAGINPGYINDEGMRGKDRSVYVCMYQSLVNILSIIPETLSPDVIIIDETQHMLCNSIKTICTFWPDAVRLGLTATLYHNSGETFRPWFTETIQTITKREAIEKGYITEPLLIVPEDYLENVDIPDLGKEYDMELQAAALGKTRIIGDMIETYENLFFGRPVIVPCATFEQSKQIKEMFCAAGWNFEHVHSDGLPKHERKRILRGITNQRINGLCTVGIGVEGMSIKGLWGVLWACRTKSPIKWTQFNGRGERIYPGKHHCLVVDFVGNSLLHGHPIDERQWTLDGEEITEEKDRIPFQVCYSCGVYNAPENTECHWCGADLSEEARKAETCEKCKHYLIDQETICAKEAFNPIFLIAYGCPFFERKGRKLPAMIDGKMVAITTDGQIQEIKDRADRIKEEQRELFEEERKRKESREAETIPMIEKRRILSKGLFSDPGRRELFREALGEM